MESENHPEYRGPTPIPKRLAEQADSKPPPDTKGPTPIPIRPAPPPPKE